MSLHPHDDSADARELARRVGEAMYAADTASKDTLGMQLLSCEPGRATMRMAVQALHLNGHKICHGGFMFTLADSTFAYACNSRNHNTVASGCSIEFLRPAHEGDELTCEGVEQTLSGRHGVYDMRITNQKGQAVALFRGKSTQISGTVIPTDDAAASSKTENHA
jgi:acyl-CoA thioesterase